MRSFSSAIIIFFQHALGDVISPPIIGAISDSSSLRRGLQVTWVMVLISGCVWFYGWIILDPLSFESFNDDRVAVRKFVDIFRKEIIPSSQESLENTITLRDQDESHDELETVVQQEMTIKNPMIMLSTDDYGDDDNEDKDHDG